MIFVILAGFGIGAAISYITNREPAAAPPAGRSPSPLLAVATPPHALPILAPASASPSPHATPRPASPAPSATPPAATPSPAPTAEPSPRATPSPLVTAVARAGAGASASPAADEVDSSFGRDAGALVRRYIGALVAGDEPAAAAALGEDASSPGLHIAEEEFIDRSSRITGLRTHTSGETVTVETDIEAARGTYFARFLVARGASGLVIRDHDFIKP
jgi:hypothetical protein